MSCILRAFRTRSSVETARTLSREVTQRVRKEYLPYLPRSGHEWSLVTHQSAVFPILLGLAERDPCAPGHPRVFVRARGAVFFCDQEELRESLARRDDRSARLAMEL